MYLILMQTLLIGLILAVAALLLLGAALLGLLHVTRRADSRRIQRMRQQLLCVISGAAQFERMKNRIHEMVTPGGTVQSLPDIRGIRSNRGLIVITETAGELSGAALEKLRRETGGDWYAAYIRNVFESVDEETMALAVKLIGVLKLSQFTQDVVIQIYCSRSIAQIQHVGMLTLCMLGAEKDIVALCRDHSIASLLSFRTLEEIFATYAGDLKKLCKKLIKTASDPYIRRTCIKTIGEHRFEELGELVLPHLVGGHINTRIDAARTLGQLRFEPAYEHILANAADPRWEMRAVVATALGSFGAERNLDTLITLLCDKEWWVRYRAAEALTRISDKDALTARVTRTKDQFAGEMMRYALEKAAFQGEGAA
jgi:hypothetical protein